LKVFLLQFLVHLTFFPINKQQPTDYIFKLLDNNSLKEQPIPYIRDQIHPAQAYLIDGSCLLHLPAPED